MVNYTYEKILVVSVCLRNYTNVASLRFSRYRSLETCWFNNYRFQM